MGEIRDMDKEKWKTKQKRIRETAEQVAEVLAENHVTYNEVPQIFGIAKDCLAVSMPDKEK